MPVLSQDPVYALHRTFLHIAFFVCRPKNGNQIREWTTYIQALEDVASWTNIRDRL